MLAQIADEEHCAFIIGEIEKHRPSGKLKALVFCRNITHARMMAEALGSHYHTAYLTGKNTVGERIRAYDDLQSESADLELLCSVDILNEGVDIPGVNMVIFLRPTESSTVFIQQLGRGLRKFPHKPHVTVLDFIGNSYKRSVQIAFALGSLAQNLVLEKRLMMSLVKDNFSALKLQEYGVKIQIDDLSKEEIEATLCDYLGCEKVIWIPLGIYNDETNGHVDNIFAVVRPGVVVIAWTDDESDPQYARSVAAREALEAATDARGRALEVHTIHIPEPAADHRGGGRRRGRVDGTLPRLTR